MPVKHYGIFVAYAPGVMLHAEGLGRLLASFLRACCSRPDLRITIVCPSWSRPDLLEMFRQEGLSGSSFTLVTPRGRPVALRLLAAYRRWSERHPRRPGRLRRWFDRVRGLVAREAEALAIRLVTVRSLPGFAWLVVVVLAAYSWPFPCSACFRSGGCGSSEARQCAGLAAIRRRDACGPCWRGSGPRRRSCHGSSVSTRR